MKQKKRFFYRGAATVVCLCLLSFLLPARTLTYREADGEITVTHTIGITPAPPGYRVELSSVRAGGGTVRQTFLTAAGLAATLAWTFSDPGRQMELAARLQGEYILLSGTLRGEKVEKKFAAAGAPWNQLFQIGLGPFALSGSAGFQFRSIGTQGPGEMKIGKFTVTRRGEEKITFGAKEITAVHLRVSLSGLLSIFWHGDYWYGKDDGRFLRFRGKNRPGGPVAVSELVAEAPADAH